MNKTLEKLFEQKSGSVSEMENTSSQEEAKTKKWFWMMEFCKNRAITTELWKQADEAYQLMLKMNEERER